MALFIVNDKHFIIGNYKQKFTENQLLNNITLTLLRFYGSIVPIFLKINLQVVDKVMETLNIYVMYFYYIVYYLYLFLFSGFK